MAVLIIWVVLQGTQDRAWVLGLPTHSAWLWYSIMPLLTLSYKAHVP